MSFVTMENEEIRNPVRNPKRDLSEKTKETWFEATAIPTTTAKPTIRELAGLVRETQSRNDAFDLVKNSPGPSKMKSLSKGFD